MSYKSFICPECKAEIMLDESRDFGFCSECGTKIPIEHRSEGASYTYGEAEANAQQNASKTVESKTCNSSECKSSEDNSVTGIFLRSVKFWK
ncbi:MAG: hypothetical protein KRP56_03215 [Candidatus Methanogranum gryphiswaldense]|nr:MAG: hypothetical protein KRP56_03215 [Candidatus Methanogranum sp. U3.2.1]